MQPYQFRMKSTCYLVVSSYLSIWPRFWDSRSDSESLVMLSNPIIFCWKTYAIGWFQAIWAPGPDSEIPDQILKVWTSSHEHTFSWNLQWQFYENNDNVKGSYQQPVKWEARTLIVTGKNGRLHNFIENSMKFMQNTGPPYNQLLYFVVSVFRLIVFVFFTYLLGILISWFLLFSCILILLVNISIT